MYGEYSVVLTWGESEQQIVHIPSGDAKEAERNAGIAVDLKQGTLQSQSGRPTVVIGYVYHQIAQINGAERINSATSHSSSKKEEEWR